MFIFGKQPHFIPSRCAQQMKLITAECHCCHFSSKNGNLCFAFLSLQLGKKCVISGDGGDQIRSQNEPLGSA